MPHGPLRHDIIEADVPWVGRERGAPLAVKGKANEAHRSFQLSQCAVVKAETAAEPAARLIPGHHRHKGDDPRGRRQDQGHSDRLGNAETSHSHGFLGSMLDEHHFIPIHSRQEHPLALLQGQVNQRGGGELSVGRGVGKNGLCATVRCK